MVERMMERTAYSKMENEGDRKTERTVERSIKRRFGKRMAGMLKTGLLFLTVLCLEGCAAVIPAGLGDSSLDGLSERSGCFTYYASACDDGDFQVKGRVYAGTEKAKDRKANVGAEDAQDWKSVAGMEEAEGRERDARAEEAEGQKQEIGMGLPDLDDMENGERAVFPGLTDNWPECIVLEDKGMSSSPLSIAFQVEKPMKIAISCMTTGGSLRVKIVNDGGQKVYFNEKDPEGDYVIPVDETGTCYMEIYAENHKGSIRIAPVQQ